MFYYLVTARVVTLETGETEPYVWELTTNRYEAVSYLADAIDADGSVWQDTWTMTDDPNVWVWDSTGKRNYDEESECFEEADEACQRMRASWDGTD